MINEKQQTHISKFLSLVLRHKPETIGIQHDQNGWIDINELIAKSNKYGIQFENGLMGGNDYKAGRYTFTTKSAMHSFMFKKPLSSGLLGPVNILIK